MPPGLARRAIIEDVRPAIDAGRFPIKRTVGEQVEVNASVFADGHDVLTVVLRDRHLREREGLAQPFPSTGHAHDALHASAPVGHALKGVPQPAGGVLPSMPQDPAGLELWRETPMTLAAPGTDRWIARFQVDAMGWHAYTVVAWVDRFGTWRHNLEVKASAGQDVSVELLEGALMIREARDRALEGGGRTHEEAEWLLTQANALSEPTSPDQRVPLALGEELASVMAKYVDRSRASQSKVLRVWVDRERARFGAWYEMFPRSAGPNAGRSGTFREAAAHLRYIADLGFDVVYLPPIHPIGTTFRKGANNSLVAGPGDPGSPWAIGSPAGGHTAIDPGLGTFADFRAFRLEAEHLGLEVGLDLAWQCSPDHPWVREHPEWFRHRPDGTIKYAENPPKRYQDIYPFDFECPEWESLWVALRDVALFWVGHGVRIFRVDNPHTKTFGFWEWFIDEIHARHPDVILLSEAFTRPALMQYLAKAGFTQSYTYFTWRNSKSDLTAYFSELTGTELAEYFRPNLFANTPDILHAYLQGGGRPAFEARLLLAATLGASYGIYSGFELCEGRAVPGTEEYADSEKYQYRKWDWDRPGHIRELVARVNAVRRSAVALQSDRTLRFHQTDNPEILAYSKSGAGSLVLVVVNLDPYHVQHGYVQVPSEAVRDSFEAHDLLDGTIYPWSGAWNYVRLEPGVRQGHVLELKV